MTINVHAKRQLTRIEGEFRDINGDLVDPSTVTLMVTNPAGVTTSYVHPGEVVRDDKGKYRYDLDADQGGLWMYRWESTGTGQAAVVGEFMVEPSAFV